jgi:hypothetical protein
MVLAGIVTVGHADAFVSFGEIREEVPKHEGYRRFEEIAQIRKAKYGDRIKDLVPTVRSKLYLYGDDGKGYGFADKLRACDGEIPSLGMGLGLTQAVNDFSGRTGCRVLRALESRDRSTLCRGSVGKLRPTVQKRTSANAERHLAMNRC